ncbi:uncharacterized protein LTHEOB_11548 [Neofusicoccum parvum]|nr:uncharacterized protein LTHEOB_11548 [Neofusicoccum parvum]
MLPSIIVSSYQQYKEDTDVIASWLASTARRCGYSVDLLQPSPTKPQSTSKSRRQKAKARKQAKEEGEQATEDTASSYVIAIKDFVALAEFIAGSTKPRVKVPQSIADVLSRAINIRKKHAQTLASQQDRTQDDEDSDKRHSYFVGILEHVKAVLQPYISLENTGDKHEEVGNVDNVFAHLTVSEPSEAFINAPDVARPSQPEADYRFEQADDLDEACTVFTLLLDDFARLRTAITKTWIAYKIGMCDIVAAAITTNTALEFARRLEEDAAGLFEKHGGIEHMLHVWYMATCQEQNKDPNYRAQPGDALNFEVYDAVTPFMWPTYQLLHAFVKLVSPTNTPIYKEGFYGTYDPSSDRRKKTAKQKHQEDTIILMSLLPEFALLCRMRDTLPIEDELVRGLHAAFTTHRLTLSTVLATQSLLDTHQHLRAHTPRGLTDMEKTAAHIFGSISQHRAFHATLTIATWPPSNDAVLDQLDHRIQTWAKDDPIRDASLRHHRPPPPTPHHLLSQHPLLCGLLAYAFKSAWQDASLALANAWGAVACCAHLYSAVRAAGLLRGRQWTDMEMLRMVVEAEGVLGPAPPGAQAEVFLQRFLLGMGWSAANFAAGGRRGKGRLQVAKGGPRGLRARAEVTQALRGRFAGGAGSGRRAAGGGFTHEELRTLLGRLNVWEEDEDLSDHEEVVEEGGGEVPQFGLTKSAMPRDKKAVRKHQRAVGRLPMEELLEKLRNALQGEVFELSFDYALMHRFCWRLLRAVKDACAEDLRRMYGPDYIEKESELPFVVGYILHASVARDQAAKYPVFESRRTRSTQSRLLVKAARGMEGMIDSGAGAMVAKVLDEQYNIVFEFE